MSQFRTMSLFRIKVILARIGYYIYKMAAILKNCLCHTIERFVTEEDNLQDMFALQNVRYFDLRGELNEYWENL